jgi:NAD(P)H-dependent FMN reductase
MRNAIFQLPERRSPSEQRQVLRAAIRQLERAEIYLAAVVYMDLDDPAADRALRQLRTDVESLRRHLSDERVAITG